MLDHFHIAIQYLVIGQKMLNIAQSVDSAVMQVGLPGHQQLVSLHLVLQLQRYFFAVVQLQLQETILSAGVRFDGLGEDGSSLAHGVQENYLAQAWLGQ